MTKKRNDAIPAARKTSTALPVPPVPRAVAPITATTMPSSRQAAPRPTARPAAVRAAPSHSNVVSFNEQTRREYIATAAYLRAERAGFRTDPVDNWLAAEREIDQLWSRRAG